MKTLSTNSSTDGLARGKAFIVRRGRSSGNVHVGTIDEELKKFSSAVLSVRDDLSRLEGDIFAAHLEMLEDPLLAEQVENHIRFDGMGAVEASHVACEELVAMFGEIDDEYLRERADDVKDVFGRIIASLTGGSVNPFEDIPVGSVIVAKELLPSDTASMDFSKIRAFVTEKGSKTSHVSIIARSHGIPALVGLKGCLEEIKDGDVLLVNGDIGTLVVNPDDETAVQFDALMAIGEETSEMIAAAAFSRAVSPNGKAVLVYGNAGNLDEVRSAIERGADGIGLFRSEFLYMQEGSLPPEERQFEAYREAAIICGGKPLTIRTLDIGGDKALPYMNLPKEDNPFLGFRAIRVSLKRPDIFKTQVRAILRASAYGKVRIMLPMITALEEVQRAKELIVDCMGELDDDDLPYNENIEVGIMIETPSAAIISDILAQEVDFFSIGTNDLTQYIMAADRGNSDVAELYDPKSTAVLRAIGMTTNAASKAGIPVGVCGEMASDLSATRILLGLGINSLSVSAPLIAKTKYNINTLHNE